MAARTRDARATACRALPPRGHVVRQTDESYSVHGDGRARVLIRTIDPAHEAGAGMPARLRSTAQQVFSVGDCPQRSRACSKSGIFTSNLDKALHVRFVSSGDGTNQAATYCTALQSRSSCAVPPLAQSIDDYEVTMLRWGRMRRPGMASGAGPLSRLRTAGPECWWHRNIDRA